MESSPLEEIELQRKAVEIAKWLFRGVYIPTEEEEESEESSITITNLRNMLDAAIDCEKKNNWDLFGLRVIFIARKASQGDDLHKFVRNLIVKITESYQNTEERLKLAKYTLTACIYVFNAYKKGLHDLLG
jgi:hypothetical protein